LSWDTAKKDWKLVNVTTRTIDSLDEKLDHSPEMHMSLNINPADLRDDEYIKDKLTTPQLKHFIQMEELRGSEGLNSLKVELYRRTATPFTVFLLAMIGVAVSSRKVRGGAGLHLALDRKSTRLNSSHD